MNKFWFRKVAFNNETVPPVVPPTVPVFTPEQQKLFNDALAVEKRKGEEKNNLLIQQIETLKKTGNLSKEEQEAAAAQVEQLRTEYMTKEQLAADSHKKKENELVSTVKAKTEEAEGWKSVFQDTLVRNEILRAASRAETEAYDADQMLDLLVPRAKIVQRLDDAGKPIPKAFDVRLPVSVKDDKGEVKVLELSPQEALLKMLEQPQHHNLFKSKIKGGLGETNSNGTISAEAEYAEAIKDPIKWKAYRLKHGYANA